MRKFFLISGVLLLVYGLACTTDEILGCINMPIVGFLYMLGTTSHDSFVILRELGKYFIMAGIFITVISLIFCIPEREQIKLSIGRFKLNNYGTWKKRRSLFQLFIYGLVIFHILMVYVDKTNLPSLCPLSLADLAAKGSFGITAIIWAIFFASVFIFGRALCGWLCIYTPVQEQSNNLLTALGHNPKKKKYKKIGLIYIFTAIFWGSVIFSLLKNIDKLNFSFSNGLSVASFWTFVGGVVTMIPLTMFLSYYFGSRFYCKYLCPIGGTFSLYSKLGLLKIAIDKNKCSNCNNCVRNCQMGVEIDEYLTGTDTCIKDEKCIVCGDCIDACVRGALSFKFGSQKDVVMDKTDDLVAIEEINV
ncbi:MAG: 4Fe-4S binding protein [Bacillota bacterium]